MDDIRKSLSKLKTDFRHRVGGKKRGPDKARTDAAGETAGLSPSLTRPDPRGTASGQDEEGSGISTGVSQARSRDRSPQPEPVQADGGGDNPQEREADADKKRAGQSHLRLAPDVGDVGGSKLSREIKQGSSPLISSVPPKPEPDSTWTLSPQQPRLITLLDNTDTAAVPDHVQGNPRPNENTEPRAATKENKPSWKSTALATAKLLLRGVRDSADAFGPLKSVAGGLSTPRRPLGNPQTPATSTFRARFVLDSRCRFPLLASPCSSETGPGLLRADLVHFREEETDRS